MSKATFAISVCFFILHSALQCRGRSLIQFDDLVSDGMNSYNDTTMYIKQLNQVDQTTTVTNSTEEFCEHMYGFLPCSSNLMGHLFQIVVYEYLLFLGERYVTEGSELVFQLVPGIFGDSVFEVLGAFPEAMILVVAGLSKSKEVAEEKVLTGVGLLAGSTVFLLTLVWGTCVIVGNNEILSNDSITNSNQKNMRRTLFSKFRSYITGYGITTDQETSYTSRIMIISIVPFILIQIPELIVRLSYVRNVITVVTLFVSIALLFLYFLYQVFQPWIQDRRLEYVKLEYIMTSFLKHVEKQAAGKLLAEDGTANLPIIEGLFDKVDTDGSANICPEEFRELIREIKSDAQNMDENDIIDEVTREFDEDADHLISKDEFVKGFAKWVVKTKDSYQQERMPEPHHPKTESPDVPHESVKEPKEKVKEVEEGAIENKTKAACKAGLLLVLGISLLTLLAEPLVEVVRDFSNSANIPSFFVSFVLLPVATNTRRTVTAISSAARKNPRTTSLTISEIYGSVFMNNVLGLIALLSLVYARDMTWNFSAEVLIILVICLIMGLLSSFRTKFPIWLSLIAYLLYPLSLLMVYILNSVLKWH